MRTLIIVGLPDLLYFVKLKISYQSQISVSSIVVGKDTMKHYDVISYPMIHTADDVTISQEKLTSIFPG